MDTDQSAHAGHRAEAGTEQRYDDLAPAKPTSTPVGARSSKPSLPPVVVVVELPIVLISVVPVVLVVDAPESVVAVPVIPAGAIVVVAAW